MTDLFQAQSYVQGVRTLVDGGCKLDVVTRELPADDMTKLFGIKGKEGWFVFSPNEIERAQVPTEPANADPKKKTKSQQLREVLWGLWFTMSDTSEDFDTVFYPREMDKIIYKIKELTPQ